MYYQMGMSEAGVLAPDYCSIVGTEERQTQTNIDVVSLLYSLVRLESGADGFQLLHAGETVGIELQSRSVVIQLKEWGEAHY